MSHEDRFARSTARTNRIATVLSGILGLNLLVAVAKLVYAGQSGALAIKADGLHSLIDAMSNVVGLIGIFVARRPPDDNHPYGHRKYETFAALAVAMLMLFGCWEIGATAFARLRHPDAPHVNAAGFLVLGLTIGINLFVVWIERSEGRRLQSELLIADAAHTRSDLMASLVVLASFGAAQLGVAWTDVPAAALIIGLILRAGFEILRGTLSTLSDERRIAPALVEAAALEEDGVLEVHNVRSRGPNDDIHVDLHVLVHPGIAISDAHSIGHRVERRLRERWPSFTDVVVHVEPALDSERARTRQGGGLKADG